MIKATRSQQSLQSLDSASIKNSREIVHTNESRPMKEIKPKESKNYRFAKTKSHAELMRQSMSTFLTDVKFKNSQEATYYPEESTQHPEERSRMRKMYKTSTSSSTFPKFLQRLDRTVDKLRKINDQVQKSTSETRLLSTEFNRSDYRGNLAVVFESDKHNSQSKLAARTYNEADFENPKGNQTLVDLVHTIDENRRANSMVEAMWGDLGDGYKTYNDLVYERKKREEFLQQLKAQKTDLDVRSNNQTLQQAIEELDAKIKQSQQQLESCQMRFETLSHVKHRNRLDLDLDRRKFTKKYGPMPKILQGLNSEMENIKADTLAIENMRHEITGICSHMEVIQKLRHTRGQGFLHEMQQNERTDQKVHVEQDFKIQREKFFAKKKRDEEKEAIRQEMLKTQTTRTEIAQCEEKLAKYKQDMDLIFRNTKRFKVNSDIIEHYYELERTNEHMLNSKESIEREKAEREEAKAKEIIELNKLKTTYCAVLEVHDGSELNRMKFEVDNKKRELESAQTELVRTERIAAGYLAGFAKIFEDIYKRKEDLGLHDLKPVTFTEENFLVMIQYLADILGKLNQIQTEAKRLGAKGRSGVF